MTHANSLLANPEFVFMFALPSSTISRNAPRADCGPFVKQSSAG